MQSPRSSARYLLRPIALLILLLLVPCRGASAQPEPATGAQVAPSTSSAPTEPPAPPRPPTAEAQDEDGVAPAVVLPQSEAQKALGLKIERIVVAGNRRVSTPDVLTYLREKVGAAFSPQALTQDVHELWQSGFFDDIEVDLQRSDTGVTLRFMLRERPNIREVIFEGNDEISKDDLTEAIEVKSNTVLSRPAIRRSIQKIRDMYAERGYFLAEVTSEIDPKENNEVIVRLKIQEHNEVTVRRVTFIGNENISDTELREVMYTGQGGILAFGSGGPFRQDAFERDIAVISGLYYDQGYLEVSVSTPRIMLTPDRDGIEISVTIHEGPRYRIRQLRVFERGADGKEVEPINGRRNLRMMVRADPGDYFNRAALMEDLGKIRTLYRDSGYANVEANPETSLHPEAAEVDVTVPIVRNQLVTFEHIEVRGNSKTRDKVIRREMEVAEGELFSETKLEDSRRRITALGYFERVDVSTEQGSAPDKMNVYIEVAERPTGTFQVGAGFSSIEQFIATAQVQQANVSGNGQSLALQGQISGLRELIDLRLYEPYFLDSRFSASIDLYNQLRVYTDFSETSRGGSLTFGYPLSEPELVASLTYTGEMDSVSTDKATTLFGTTSTAISVFRRLPLFSLFQDGFTSSLRPGLTYDTRNDRIYPTSGVYMGASTELALDVFGSQNQFVRNRFTGRFYYPLFKGLTLKLNTEALLVTSPTSDGVPIFARSFLGGILDVRGFRFRTIGPRIAITTSLDPNSSPRGSGANIGGNLSYYQNLELEFSIVESAGIRGVVFTDAGNAWNLEEKYCDATATMHDVTSPCFHGLKSLGLLRTSWGVGLRWFSPMGPLRFEWGFPFEPLPYEESNVFEFTIGNFF
ncbi:MAG: outer membrane protein assembly factor BamA [Polyangiaceae bacterium]|nr:outer membrane protein assembly factor BamA [Polyangiaceae bacterium]